MNEETDLEWVQRGLSLSPSFPTADSRKRLVRIVRELAEENERLRDALEDALPTMNCKMFETIHAKFVKALGKGE